MIGKKSKKKQPTDNDFTSLDAAVSELAKQTEALLGGAKKPKKSTPSAHTATPKPVKSRGRSFDIINPASPAKTSTPLKKPAQKKVRASLSLSTKDEKLLPAQAGQSYNEVVEEKEPNQPDTPAEDTANPSAVIVGHESAVLRAEDDQGGQNDQVAEATPEDRPNRAASTDEPTQETPAHKGITFTDPDPAEAAEAPEAAADTGELAAHNLVKDTTPKGYTTPKGQQKPTVFDTKEYHPELHDWSRLGRTSHASLVILLLLVVGLGIITYVVVFNQKLPL